MSEQIITILLRLIHILAGIFWAGTAFFMAGFLTPTMRETGPEGGRFMQHLMQRRRVSMFLGFAMLFTVVSGLLMYARLTSATHGTWARTGPGMAYGVGALTAVLAAVVGAGYSGSAGRRMIAIGRNAGAGGPSAEQQAEIQRLQARIGVGTRVTAALLVVTAGAMAVARYL